MSIDRDASTSLYDLQGRQEFSNRPQSSHVIGPYQEKAETRAGAEQRSVWVT
jgi:hypothetical protein